MVQSVFICLTRYILFFCQIISLTIFFYLICSLSYIQTFLPFVQLFFPSLLKIILESSTVIIYADTEIRHFHQFRTTWGSPNFIQTKQFKAKDKEYIFDDDQCVFGVDISVYPYFNQWEILSIDKTVYGPNSWKLMKFSTLTRDFYISDDFSVGGKNW